MHLLLVLTILNGGQTINFDVNSIHQTGCEKNLDICSPGDGNGTIVMTGRGPRQFQASLNKEQLHYERSENLVLYTSFVISFKYRAGGPLGTRPSACENVDKHEFVEAVVSVEDSDGQIIELRRDRLNVGLVGNAGARTLQTMTMGVSLENFVELERMLLNVEMLKHSGFGRDVWMFRDISMSLSEGPPPCLL